MNFEYCFNVQHVKDERLHTEHKCKLMITRRVCMVFFYIQYRLLAIVVANILLKEISHNAVIFLCMCKRVENNGKWSAESTSKNRGVSFALLLLFFNTNKKTKTRKMPKWICFIESSRMSIFHNGMLLSTECIIDISIENPF